MATPREIGMELLRDFADKLAKQVQDELGISAAKAKAFAEDAAGRLADDWGGQTVYLPMDMIGRRSTRNKQIYREFNGDNQSELALKYGLSRQCIYRIIKEQGELRMPKQASLLNLDVTSPQDHDRA
ncbi:Mor transcription activator family protein [Humidesulfovibrio mexicanus]|uniref:Mor transcription activator family protein n=1 Tax=Humidesulfovibrio mexicanus TaxID=147047 RepID=A0A239BGS8_9BACT|nr:Mor transcription activator family protein [Humidesulfovibrio mexicanus]SNS06294.1 Mor transcription activator family protein [Humidesulfovibrio mexicanus]